MMSIYEENYICYNQLLKRKREMIRSEEKQPCLLFKILAVAMIPLNIVQMIVSWEIKIVADVFGWVSNKMKFKKLLESTKKKVHRVYSFFAKFICKEKSSVSRSSKQMPDQSEDLQEEQHQDPSKEELKNKMAAMLIRFEELKNKYEGQISQITKELVTRDSELIAEKRKNFQNREEIQQLKLASFNSQQQINTLHERIQQYKLQLLNKDLILEKKQELIIDLESKLSQKQQSLGQIQFDGKYKEPQIRDEERQERKKNEKSESRQEQAQQISQAKIKQENRQQNEANQN